MRVFLYASCLLWVLATKVQSKPQVTKLFPVQELVTYHQQVSNDTKPLDRLVGKLRATYNFVFRKPDNTSNVEKILAKDAPNPDAEKLRAIWSQVGNAKEENMNEEGFQELQSLSRTKDDWFEEVEPLSALELQNEADDRDVEMITPDGTSFRLPATIGRQLIEWIGSLLGLTYGLYSKVATVIHSNYNTTATEPAR